MLITIKIQIIVVTIIINHNDIINRNNIILKYISQFININLNNDTNYLVDIKLYRNRKL